MRILSEHDEEAASFGIRHRTAPNAYRPWIRERWLPGRTEDRRPVPKQKTVSVSLCRCAKCIDVIVYGRNDRDTSSSSTLRAALKYPVLKKQDSSQNRDVPNVSHNWISLPTKIGRCSPSSSKGLREIKEALRHRMHRPIPETGKWLAQIVAG
jgi:hypothetical protein